MSYLQVSYDQIYEVKTDVSTRDSAVPFLVTREFPTFFGSGSRFPEIWNFGYLSGSLMSTRRGVLLINFIHMNLLIYVFLLIISKAMKLAMKLPLNKTLKYPPPPIFSFLSLFLKNYFISESSYLYFL
ncbi:unnamed protein product [Meloidogyne enterolobii]|uniref:Uncharacterized protein n=1 Tax=Meloidogyne enterolobii TaxID=390850 RepID=A0ACB1ARD3_MELEN